MVVKDRRVFKTMMLFSLFLVVLAVAQFSRAGMSQSAAGAPKGACRLICGEKLFKCVDAVEKPRCTDEHKYEVFGAIPRCPHMVEFSPGAKCTQNPEQK